MKHTAVPRMMPQKQFTTNCSSWAGAWFTGIFVWLFLFDALAAQQQVRRSIKLAILGHSPIRNTRFFFCFLSGLTATKILFASQASCVLPSFGRRLLIFNLCFKGFWCYCSVLFLQKWLQLAMRSCILGGLQHFSFIRPFIRITYTMRWTRRPKPKL